VTVDVVVFTIVGQSLRVLLVKRGGDPYRGKQALPGGFKRPDETLDEAAMRELREETGLDAAGRLVQLGAYGDPERDPRMNVVTVAYRAVVPVVGDLAAGSDATATSLWTISDIAGGMVRLAFDHDRILRDALERTRIELGSTDLALAFVGRSFTLTELRGVYEAIWEVHLDPANFRRTVLGAEQPFVEPTGRREMPGSGGGRPAELYRAAPSGWLDGGPLRRPRNQLSSQSNKRLFREIRGLRREGKLKEALEIVPPHWTTERTAILASLDASRVEPDVDDPDDG
jgi:8-oxo-dGTP diphosphatase